MDINDEADERLREADEDEVIDDGDPGITADEEIDDQVDGDGGAALHKRTD